MKISQISSSHGTVNLEKLANVLALELRRKGYIGDISPSGFDSVTLKMMRLTEDFVECFGRNRTIWGAKDKFLSWENWTVVNETIQDVLDRCEISAVVTTTMDGETMFIRQGTTNFGPSDWEDFYYIKKGRYYLGEMRTNDNHGINDFRKYTNGKLRLHLDPYEVLSE